MLSDLFSSRRQCAKVKETLGKGAWFNFRLENLCNLGGNFFQF